MDKFFDIRNTWFEPISDETAVKNLEPDDPIEKDSNLLASSEKEGDSSNKGVLHSTSPSDNIASKGGILQPRESQVP